MSKEDDYRANAAKMVGLANRTGMMREKGRLVVLAEKWLDLAERAHLIAGRSPTGQHPQARKEPGDGKIGVE